MRWISNRSSSITNVGKIREFLVKVETPRYPTCRGIGQIESAWTCAVWIEKTYVVMFSYGGLVRVAGNEEAWLSRN